MPSALFERAQSMIWRGVVGSWSSPRMTCEIAMVRSSTALASTKSALPLPFTQMKSSSARSGNSSSPRTRSCTRTTPSSGVRKRSARPSRGAGPGRGSARRSLASGRRPPPAACVRSSISSRVHAQA